MKIICVEYSESGVPVIVPVGDNALLRNNQDFFFPEFTDELSCIPQLVIRISKLGKSIPERFAGRYYEELGVGVRFYADTLEVKLRAEQLPVVMASSFDNSAVISPLQKIGEVMPSSYSLFVNGNQYCRIELQSIQSEIDRLLSLASNYHTLKIGDYLYCGFTERFHHLRIGDRVQLNLGEQCLSDFFIR